MDFLRLWTKSSKQYYIVAGMRELNENEMIIPYSTISKNYLGITIPIGIRIPYNWE